MTGHGRGLWVASHQVSVSAAKRTSRSSRDLENMVLVRRIDEDSVGSLRSIYHHIHHHISPYAQVSCSFPCGERFEFPVELEGAFEGVGRKSANYHTCSHSERGMWMLDWQCQTSEETTEGLNI